MDIQSAEKVNTLAKSLKKTGLANSLKEAVEKAQEILFGKHKKENIEETFKEDEPMQKIQAQEENISEIAHVEDLFAEEPVEEEPKQEEKVDIFKKFEEIEEQKGVEEMDAEKVLQKTITADEDYDITKDTRTVEDIFKELDIEMIRTNDEINRMQAKKDEAKITQKSDELQDDKDQQVMEEEPSEIEKDSDLIKKEESAESEDDAEIEEKEAQSDELVASGSKDDTEEHKKNSEE